MQHPKVPGEDVLAGVRVGIGAKFRDDNPLLRHGSHVGVSPDKPGRASRGKAVKVAPGSAINTNIPLMNLVRALHKLTLHLELVV